MAAGLYRVASGLGESDLGVDATMVSRWERGTRHPRPRYVRLLCQLFELPAEQLGLVRDADVSVVPLLPSDRLGSDETERRDFIEGMAAMLGAAPLTPDLRGASTAHGAVRMETWDRLDRALSRPGQIDLETVGDLERVTVALEAMEPTAISSRTLLGPATGHLNAISTLLLAPLPSLVRGRLCSLAGETAALVGWLRWNQDDVEGATACFRAGMRAAREADDRALGAYLVGAMACRTPARQAPAITLQLLGTRAFGFAREDASATTAAWLAAKEADAWAQLGNEDECMRALDLADEIVDRIDVDDLERRPRHTTVDRNWLAGERGASLARLGRVEEARAILRPVLAALGPTSERDRLWLLVALAGAYAESGEPEEACELARSALIGAARMQLAPVVQLIARLRTRLDQHRRTQAVRDLDEHLRAVSGAMSRTAATT